MLIAFFMSLLNVINIAVSQSNQAAVMKTDDKIPMLVLNIGLGWLETALNLKILKKSVNCFVTMERKPWKVCWANQNIRGKQIKSWRQPLHL